MSLVYISIGSNLGNRYRNIEEAIEQVKRIEGVAVKKVSSVYESPPVGQTEQPHFLNATICIETDSRPEKLLETLLEIENKMGRVRNYRYGPRNIDLDIILFDDIIMENEKVKIPHPRMVEREFVLRPLSEISCEIMHPIYKKSVRELLEELIKKQGGAFCKKVDEEGKNEGV